MLTIYIFNFKKEFVDEQKKSISSISLCEYNTNDIDFETNASNLDLWRFYGQDGKGVAIKFVIENTQEKWDSFHLCPILYGKEKLDYFMLLANILEDFNKKHPHLYLHFIKIFAFYKNKIFQNEKEVRLIFSSYFDNERNDIIFNTAGFNDDHYPKKSFINNSFYISLPLTNNLNDRAQKAFLSRSPNIKIDEIILGYRFSLEEELLYRKLFNNLLKEKAGYVVPENKIYRTKLVDLFR
jgi:hypothetical protein